MPMSPRLLRPRASGLVLPSDADARAYVLAVNTADGQPLEAPVVQAIDAFVIGCKADGIWSAIKASCILMGARTLSGALTPLAGSAPTNNNFVSGDYNRKTGLVGDGTSKFINTNRANNADPQDSQHMAVYLPSAAAAVGTGFASFIAADGGITNGTSVLNYTNSGGGVSADSVVIRSRSANAGSVAGAGPVAGFKGASRSGSASYIVRAAGSNTTITEASQAPTTRNLFVFAQNATAGTANYNASRIAFYSIGESLTLASLDSRVTTLYNAIGAAIP